MKYFYLNALEDPRISVGEGSFEDANMWFRCQFVDGDNPADAWNVDFSLVISFHESMSKNKLENKMRVTDRRVSIRMAMPMKKFELIKDFKRVSFQVMYNEEFQTKEDRFEGKILEFKIKEIEVRNSSATPYLRSGDVKKPTIIDPNRTIH